MAPQQTAQVDKLLTNISNKIVPQNYISEMILPMVQVKQSTGKLGAYGTSHLRIETTLTGGKNKYPRVDTRQYSTQNYNIDKHGLSDIITEEDKANVEAPFDAEVDTTDELVTKLWLGKEKGLADTLTDTAIITQNVTLSGTSQYSDYTNSDPLGDFSTARSTIFNSVGKAPDTAIMSWDTWNILRYHPDFLTALGYADQRPGGLSTDELAKAMDVKRLLVGEAVYESANEGQTSSIASVWGKHVIFCVSPTTAAKRQISLGYRFQQFGGPRRVFKNAVTNPPMATEVLVDDSYEMLISQALAAYLIKDAVA
jgi:hypothetical protein